MTPQLQRIFQDLNQLNSSERWQVVEYLINQFKSTTGHPSDASLSEEEAPFSAQEIFTATLGSWGNKSIDEIDTQLAHQRQFDWGE